VFLVRSGFLSVFFLVPLGVMGVSFERRAAWGGAALAVLVNAACSLVLSVLAQQGFAGGFVDLGFFSLIVAFFMWLIAPPVGGPGFLRVRAAYRLLLGALAGSLAFLGLGIFFRDLTGLSGFVRSQAQALSSLYVASAGGDAVRRSILEQELTPDRIVEVFNLVLIRGGGIASCMVVFFINRQLSLGAAAIVRRFRPRSEIQEGGGPTASLRSFRAPLFLIWVLSGALAGILLFRVTALAVLEMAAWNLLTMGVLVYMAQGLGIVQFILGRRDLPVPLRLLLNIGIILVVFSPGLNAIALGLLALLGVAEHWVPLRVIKQDRPPSTPAV
jgi:hypothetical protein